MNSIQFNSVSHLHPDLEGVSEIQVSRLPRSVEITAKNIENNFASTAELLITTAEKLEARADDLRQKARWLLEQRGIAHDLRTAVTYEQTAMDDVKSLALVDIGIRQDG